MLATVFFAFQIFCDFSGYSDIAIGTARCMGYTLMRNFDRPYMSQSVGEFWRRWHISLSTWFRDYVYVPLGGNRVTKWRWYLNIMIVFILSGIWHGANWTFAIWGMLHGVYLVAENVILKKRPEKNQSVGIFSIIFKRGYVFILVTIAWVFFRAKDVSTAFYVIGNFFTGIPQQCRQILHNENLLRLKLLYMNQSGVDFFEAIIFMGIMIGVHFAQKGRDFDQWLTYKPSYVRWPVYYGLLLTFICFGIFDKSGFIYFQF
jgi:D-alanyl-lipoteichoic acid acyltransferase DltB (MBOAT superfamily)